MLAKLCEHSKNRWAACFQCVNCRVYEFYLKAKKRMNNVQPEFYIHPITLQVSSPSVMEVITSQGRSMPSPVHPGWHVSAAGGGAVHVETRLFDAWRLVCFLTVAVVLRGMRLFTDNDQSEWEAGLSFWSPVPPLEPRGLTWTLAWCPCPVGFN